MEPCQHPERKRHAQLRHQPRSTPLWVGDPDDWALVRHKPRPPLVCPEPGCEVELISYENLNNQYNPRIFKFKSVNRSCDHWFVHGGGGGPESAQHEWMKLRLTRIAKILGYTATLEHAPAYADVFVRDVSFCLEVQFNPTQFRQRTKSREGKGAKVCWLIREGWRFVRGSPALRPRIIARSVAPTLARRRLSSHRPCALRSTSPTIAEVSSTTGPRAERLTPPRAPGPRPARSLPVCRELRAHRHFRFEPPGPLQRG